jgi:hypothetical protein
MNMQLIWQPNCAHIKYCQAVTSRTLHSYGELFTFVFTEKLLLIGLTKPGFKVTGVRSIRYMEFS